MFPSPHQTHRSTVAEIRRIEVRLATAQYLRGVLIPHLNDVKTKYLTQNADIAHFRNQISQAQQQAQALLANNRSTEHEQKVRFITELNTRIAFSVHGLEKSGARIEKVTQNIRDRDLEILGFENLLHGLRNCGY